MNGIDASLHDTTQGATGAVEEPLIAFIGPKGDGAPLEARAFGSKAAQLWRMHALGLNVPPAFVLSTALCGRERQSRTIERLVAQGIGYLEMVTGRGFGDRRAPLLVAVRSGAEKSMPGMLETVLDVGATPEAVRGLMRLYGNPRLAWDCGRRFLESWFEVVEGLPRASFEGALKDLLASEQVTNDRALDPEALERLCGIYADLARSGDGVTVPADPRKQLEQAVEAVFRSWDAPKAREYRRLNQLEDLSGTAVTVQAMVFGNAGARSGSGVAFSRDPATGAKDLYADMLFEAQGEDVVSGRRQPVGLARLEALMPRVAAELKAGVSALEAAYRDVQDVEFTVEEGQLWFLQTRAAKRTPLAALRIAVDLVNEGVRTEAEGLRLLDGIDLSRVATSHFSGSAEPVGQGIGASPGTVAGRVAFDTEAARRFADGGVPVIFVRPDVATEDIVGLSLAAGVLTAIGGRTAHAAVVARQLGLACVVGCGALVIDVEGRRARLGTHDVAEGDWLSLDGEAGTVFLGHREVVRQQPDAALATIARWRAGVCGAAKEDSGA